MISPAPIEVECLPQFKVLYNPPPGTNLFILIGGRGGAKTYEASKYVAYSATVHKKRCAVLRDEKETIRESILNEVLLRYDTANEYGALDAEFIRLDTGIKDRETGEALVFTKGFRASDNQKKANLKSISNVDIAVVEEAEDIRDEKKFNTFADSIRKEGSIIIIVLNTPDINHWIIKRYFTLTPAKNKAGEEIDGFFEIVPKKIPGFVCITTSFRDNPFLPQHIIDKYNGYGDPDHHLFDEYYYYSAIEGYATTGRIGQILKKVKPITLAEYLALPYKEHYGQDFGTSSPAGLVGVKFHKNNCYCRQINYLPKDTKAIGKMYCSLKFNNSDKIVADSAEPKTINKLANGWTLDELDQEEIQNYPALLNGFYVVGAAKGPGSITSGIMLMTSLNLYAVEESKDLWNEIYNWVYAKDKNEQPTDEPEDAFNHLIDPWRYVIMDYKGENSHGYKRQN